MRVYEHPTRAGALVATSNIHVRVADDRAAVVDFTASDGSEDRYGSVLSPLGWITDTFERLGGPILAFHDYASPPVGKTLKVTKTSTALMLRVQFAVSQSERASEIYRLVRDGYLSGMSVGFLPIEMERYQASTVPKDRAENVKYLKQELLEASVVAVPANRHSLKAAYDAMASVRSFLNGASFEAPHRPPRPAGMSEELYRASLDCPLKPTTLLRLQALMQRGKSNGRP